MKPISQTQALERLKNIQADLRSEISNFESRAKSCLTCDTPGACCLDAHFVNVHISRLEAGARVPSLQMINELAVRLGVSSQWLATQRSRSPAGRPQAS